MELPRPALIGVVHLLPLPGAPFAREPLAGVLARAVADARAYAAGGADAIILENFGDRPFFADTVPPVVVAAMTRVALAVREQVKLPLGINVLRNAAEAALGIAVAVEAAFIRVNVLTGVMVTDQGLITGPAATLLRQRRLLAAPVEIWADVLVKHAQPLAPVSLEQAARETLERGGADALILTGPETGSPPALADLARLRATLPSARLYLGSGVTPDLAAAVRDRVDGCIVGTWAKVGGQVTAPVDPQRVAALRHALRPA